MSVLGLKRRRDIRRQRWQFVAVAITLGLGVLLFAATYDAYRNLEASYNGTYDRLDFADLTALDAGRPVARALADQAGVDRTLVRRQADVGFRIGGDLLFGRVIGMPPDHQPSINRIQVDEGSYLRADRADGVVIESHLATESGLEAGDRFEIRVGDQWRPVTVEGIAVSAEYLWPARSSQDIFPPPGTFGVAFVAEALVDELPASAVESQVLVAYDRGVDRQATDRDVAQAALTAGAGDTVTRADQPSNQTLQLDVKGFAQLSVLFPALFLLAAGLAAVILVNRLVFQQRPQIGTLLANGVGRRAIRRHYLGYGLLPAAVGTAVGATLGMALGWATTGVYTESLGIPDTVRHLHPLTPLIAVLFGLGTGLAAAAAPTRHALRLSPAEAMRAASPTARARRTSLERLIAPLARLPVRWVLVLRGLVRSPRRSLSTVVGVVLALVLVMVSWGMIDTVDAFVARQFDEISREDATAALVLPVTDEAVGRIAEVPGVARAEAVVRTSATLQSDDRSYSTDLQAFEPDTTMHGFPVPLPDDGILGGAALADRLDLAVGDPVTVRLESLGTEFTVPLRGFVDEPLGTYVYLSRPALEQALTQASPRVDAARLADPTVTSVLLQTDPGSDRTAVIDRVTALDEVALVVDERELVDLVDQTLVFLYAFVGVMLVFGGAMALALIFNTISVNVAERAGEYATMRANGVGQGRIARLIAGENLLLTAAGCGAGDPGRAGGRRVVHGAVLE